MQRLAKLVFLLSAAIAAYLWIPNIHQGQVEALLNESGASYQLINCAGGWTTRELHCEILVPFTELNTLIAGLELDQQLPYFEPEERIVYVDASSDPCSSSVREEYAASFAVQQWSPSRYGFDSAILFYNRETERGCLFLSIAYG